MTMKINKDQISMSKWKDFVFSYKRGQGHLIPFLINRFGWHYYPRLHYVPRFPIHLDIESSASCNMRCPMCFTVTEEFKNNIEKGLMDFSIFKKVIDEATKYKLYSIRISHRGEPFIHPEIIEFIKYAKKQGIKEVASLTNALALTPELFKQIMEAGLDWLTISIDGLGKTYEDIRRPAKFADVVEKIKAYKRIKDEAKSVKPVIKIQSIWPAIEDCAEEYVKLFNPYVDCIASNPLVDYLHKDNPEEIEYWKNFDCHVPYQRLTILFNGQVPYCHNDEFLAGIIGDVNNESLYNIWHGRKMTEVRQAHKEHKGVVKLPACKYCFLSRKATQSAQLIGGKKIKVDRYTGRSQEVGQ